MSQLSDIAPINQLRVIDLVRVAGVDVSGWKNFKGGKKREASNPKYCYEWSFVEPKKVVVLNLWYSAMEEETNGGVVVRNVVRNMNMRQFASEVSGTEKVRALKFDAAIQIAIKDKLPIRVIVCDGKRRSLRQTDGMASHVSKRLLDPVSWKVSKYNWNTGECTLVRGNHRFVDQFSIKQEPNQKPAKRDVSSQAYVRSAIIRSNVLLRANGKCEWCGQSGFIMPDGKIYLETHHVIPLSKNGLDNEKNVVALCPNHHREAHHGIKKAQMCKELLKHLAYSA